MIPTSYYTYTGSFGVSVDWLNITVFFLAAGTAYWLENLLFQKEYACGINACVAFLLICMIGIVFTVFTFFPPEIPFFRDPITGSYGFQR